MFVKLNLLHDFILPQAQKFDGSGVAIPYPVPTLAGNQFFSSARLKSSDGERLCQQCVKLEREMFPSEG